MIYLVHTITPFQPRRTEALSVIGLAWVAYFLTLALLIGRLA
ncbi:MAG TPA: hypothetical protein PK677_11275 [Acidiphilium sp.]|nr:hypothetical protein [Acidiphilium sp.]